MWWCQEVLVIYAQRHKPVTEENDRIAHCHREWSWQAENGRATMKHDEAKTEGRRLSDLMLPPTRRRWALLELTTISGLRINSFTAQTPSWESRLGLSSRLGYSSRAARFPYDDSVGVRTQSSFGMYCVCYIYVLRMWSRGGSDDIHQQYNEKEWWPFVRYSWAVYDGVTTAKRLFFFFCCWCVSIMMT